jgi:hypothetical protein
MQSNAHIYSVRKKQLQIDDMIDWLLSDDTVTRNFDVNINLSEIRRWVRPFTVLQDVYSTFTHLQMYIIFLLCTLFHTRVHKVKFDQTESNEQYLTGQTQMKSNDWYHVNRHWYSHCTINYPCDRLTCIDFRWIIHFHM